MSQFISPAAGPVTSPYGPRGSGFHTGMDIGAPDKSPIVASASGRIIFEALVPLAGNMIEIDHGNGFKTKYEHLSSFTVHLFDDVTQGQLIGYTGGAKGELGSGNATGPHLHFEILRNNQPVNPANYLTPTMGAVTPIMGPAGVRGRADAGNATPEGLKLAASNPQGLFGTGLGNPVNLLPGGKALGTITGFLTTTSNWKRIGLGLIGVSLLGIAIIKIFPSTNIPIPVPV